MKYVGSKGRHAKHILPIILAGRREGQAYVEPFVGGANSIQHVDGIRIAGDANSPLIDMWKAAENGWSPPALVTEEDYAAYKIMHKNGDRCPEIAYAAFSLSFGGKWFGGYRRDKKGIDGVENEIFQSEQSKRVFEKQSLKIKGVKFHDCGYLDLPIPDESIIYCDPPYANSLGYSTGGFDHSEFWQWCRDMVKSGHSVFVSEYVAPDDFVCVWSKPVNNTLDKDTGAKSAVERLFVHESQYGR